MPKDDVESKPQPLTPVDIKHVLLDRGDTIASLARDWKEEGLDVTSWKLRAVIYRNPEVVYQEIRERLARYIGCEVSQVGREPSVKSVTDEEIESEPTAAIA